MGLQPDEFYAMEFSDFMLKHEGWNDKLIYDQAVVRKQTFIIAMTFGAKFSDLEKSWPDPSKPGLAKRMVVYKGVTMTEGQMKKLVELKENSKKKKAAKNV